MMATGEAPVLAVPKPPRWRFVFLKWAGFGVGFALALAGVLMVVAWWLDRPHPPKPWDSKAITATLDQVNASQSDNHLFFTYIVRNNTLDDFEVGSASAHINARLTGGALAGCADTNSCVTTTFPIRIPAKESLVVELNLPNYKLSKEMPHDTAEERKAIRLEAARYATEELPRLNGFVLFDDAHRYQIEFPSGWRTGPIQTQSK